MDNTADETQFLFNESADPFDLNTVTISYLFCIVGGLLSVLIMCGNLLVIISIAYFKQLHCPTNYLLLSLAVADLLVGIFILPLSIVMWALSNWSVSTLLCKLRNSLDFAMCSSSIANLCCISVDRYYAVCQPLRYKSKMTVRVVGIMIISSWCVAMYMGFFFTFMAPSKGQSKKLCVIFQTKAQSSIVIGAVFTFGIPVFLMITAYFKIFLVAQRQARSILSLSKTTVTVSTLQRKATKTLAIVLGVFLMSWTPFFVCISLNNSNIISKPTPVIQFFKWIGWSNSMFNPCIYAFFYRRFRTAFAIIISGNIFRENASNFRLL